MQFTNIFPIWQLYVFNLDKRTFEGTQNPLQVDLEGDVEPHQDGYLEQS